MIEGKESERGQEVPDNELTLEILYKKASKEDYERYPKDKTKKVPADGKLAVIPGAFDLAEPYDIKLHIYEGDQPISALRNETKTEPIKAGLLKFCGIYDVNHAEFPLRLENEYGKLIMEHEMLAKSHVVFVISHRILLCWLLKFDHSRK